MLIKFLDGSEREVSNLRGANLRGANLREANLSRARVSRGTVDHILAGIGIEVVS